MAHDMDMDENLDLVYSTSLDSATRKEYQKKKVDVA